MKLRTKILTVVAAIIIYVNIGHLFAYYPMYAIYFPESMTAKILMPLPPFNYGTPEYYVQLRVQLRERYVNFTDYYQKNLDRYLIIVFWPLLVIVFWIFILVSWIVFVAYLAITGELLRWINLLP